jgi:hypothetical protein
MIESVTQEKFYKDVRHDSFCPAVPKDPRASRAGSSAAPAGAPSRTTRSGGAPSAPATNSGILNMLWDIFTMCQHTDQRLDVMDQRLQIVRRSQEIIHSQQDEPLHEFLDVPVFPPVSDPYGSLTPTELAALVLLMFLQTTMMRHRPTTMRRRRTMSSQLHFIALFPFWYLDDKGGEECYLYSYFSFYVACNMDKNLLNMWLVIL